MASQIHHFGHNCVRLVLFCGFTVLATGCAEFQTLNPLSHHEWKEDEAYGPTFHQRVQELARIRGEASGYSEAQRATVGEQLANLFGQDKDPLIREHALRTVGHVGGNAAYRVVAAALLDTDSHVRIVACRTCQQLGGNEVEQLLAKTVKEDEDLDVRLEAIRALSNFRGEATTDALRAVLAEDDPALQYRAMVALREVTGKDFRYNVDAWTQFLSGETPHMQPRESVANRWWKLF